jgi:hypothetical protein
LKHRGRPRHWRDTPLHSTKRLPGAGEPWLWLPLNGDHQGAASEARQAVAISPNLASAHGALGTVLIYSGRGKGSRLLSTTPGSTHVTPGSRPVRSMSRQDITYLATTRAAIEAANRTIRSYPDHPSGYRWLTQSLGQSGQLKEAREAQKKALAMGCASFDLHVRRRPPWMAPKTTPTCSKACARPAGPSDGYRPSPRRDPCCGCRRLLVTDGRR